MASKPIIYYFPLRGRAEVMKLALSAAHVDFDIMDVEYADMKSNRTTYPFGQCPRFVDGDLNLVQSNSILRYIARKCKLQGTTEKEITTVDMIMEGVEALRVKYVNLIYNDKLEEAAKQTYWKTYFDKSTTEGRNGGAHMAYLSSYLAAGDNKHCVGSSVTMADLCLFDITDLHMRIFGDEIKEAYPELVAFHTHIAGLPGIKEYLASPRRLDKINANSLG